MPALLQFLIKTFAVEFIKESFSKSPPKTTIDIGEQLKKVNRATKQIKDKMQAKQKLTKKEIKELKDCCKCLCKGL